MPGSGSDIRLTLPARPENVGVVRHVVGALSEALDLPAALTHDIRLAVTEACTNVVRHAYAGGEGPIDVTVQLHEDSLEIVVSDRGNGLGASVDATGPGLGLPLIAAVADGLEIGGAESGSHLRMRFRQHRDAGVPRPA